MKASTKLSLRSRLCYLTIDCNDLERAVDFWSQVLQATEEPVHDGSEAIYRRLKMPDSELRILLQLVPELKSSKNGMHLDIETNDVEFECQRLEHLGATRYLEKNDRGYHFWIMLDLCNALEIDLAEAFTLKEAKNLERDWE